ncbi:HNH endonuclease [Vibrio parahaemolyticus]|nr:HNH endonuclease [Vibrio parahaemolyticus]
MPLLPVTYRGKLLEQVEGFNKKPRNEKSADFWEDKRNEQLRKHIKDHYIRKQNFTCVYCRQHIEVKHNGSWDAEHIIPKDKYPSFLFIPENLCVSCKDCNGQKSNKNVLTNTRKTRFPTKSEDYLIYHPHFDNYEDCITLLENSLFFVPKNNKGLKTIETCGLLRFLYKFSNHDTGELEDKIQITKLTTRLMEAQTAMEQTYIYSLLEVVIARGKKACLEKSLEEL